METPNPHLVHLIVLEGRVDADEVCLGVVVLAPASGLAPGHLALARQVAGVGLHRPAVRAVHLGWGRRGIVT